jgi:hypothetical protein
MANSPARALDRILLDVSLDNAGVPEGADLAWRSKHFLGMPVPGATMAFWNETSVASPQLRRSAKTLSAPTRCK